MIVSNASPLVALARLQRMDLLKTLFGRVVIPRGVYRETVEHDQIPGDQKHQIQRAIDEGYLEIIDTSETVSFSRISLGEGERGVLLVALEYPLARLIIDDRRARNEAKALGFEDRLTFTSDILRFAADQGLIEYEDAMNTLRNHGIMLPEK